MSLLAAQENAHTLLIAPCSLGAAERGRPGITRGRGMAKVGTGRGLPKVGTGRGMAKVGTGRGMGKVGTGRGMAKVGTGRGMASVGKGRGLPKVSTGTINIFDPKPSDGGGGYPAPPNFPEGVITPKGSDAGNGADDPSSTPDSAGANKQAGIQAESTSVARTRAFSAGVKPLIFKGDAKMKKKDYRGASWEYYTAQQAEGFRGSSNLRMAGAMIATGRYYEGENCMRLFVEHGGRIDAKSFIMPEDSELEARLDEQVRRSPHDTSSLLSHAAYALSQGKKSKAAKTLARLREVHPGHPCLRELEAMVNEGKSEQ
jgi:hypothetical protein